MKQIVCYGEVLWDMLPTGKKLGGAPLNLALRMQSYGCSTKVISSIGNDAAGKGIVEQMKTYNATTDHLQVSQNYATSEVLVTLNDAGSASYEIKMPCAWDDIQLLEKDIAIVKSADAFIYGSLVARQQTSRETLFALLKTSPFKVFDVNLRPPHYELNTLTTLMKQANFIKFNDDEIIELSLAISGKKLSIEESIRFFSKETQTPSICVTLGADGAVLFQDNKFVYNKGYNVKVADTVGAGDSFLATLIYQLLTGANAVTALDYACAVGAIVASKEGANPIINDKEIQEIMT
ncbi:fructokinase [Mariniflexile fucanivorans]|uniref:Fructokinase n=1 Tax=Mariniflexile fucanivorans TaxID=264023 RepID=A0A4R1RD92_9FLAO|nr:carbohydrate kinase [Mariniflexile fucanivorans]TCL63472.1 fructokinase [Mariniflexile fucanivorans]